MSFLHHVCLIPLVFACQFVSACHSSASGVDALTTQQNLISEPESVQTAEVKVKKRTPVWKGNVTGEDPLDSASNIYFESLDNPPGVYEYQGLVFCIVEIPLVKEHEEKRYYQMKGMLAVKESLQEHYNLPSSFQLQQRVMENKKDDDFVYYRYATVYRLKDIQALQQK